MKEKKKEKEYRFLQTLLQTLRKRWSKEKSDKKANKQINVHDTLKQICHILFLTVISMAFSNGFIKIRLSIKFSISTTPPDID